jgi:hypothetical protein
VFTSLCVEYKKMTDFMLAAVTSFQDDAPHLPPDSKTLDRLMATNNQIMMVERMLRAIIVDDEEDPRPTGGNGGVLHA